MVSTLVLCERAEDWNKETNELKVNDLRENFWLKSMLDLKWNSQNMNRDWPLKCEQILFGMILKYFNMKESHDGYSSDSNGVCEFSKKSCGLWVGVAGNVLREKFCSNCVPLLE